MLTGSAMAQGRGNGRGNAPANVWNANRDWRGDRDRWTFGDDQRPRGWDRGKKNGWRDCDVPPGQAKKMGCMSLLPGMQRDRRQDWRYRNEHERREQYRRSQQYRRDRDHDRR